MTQKHKMPQKSYRTIKCKSFWEKGTCSYGKRCQFSHYESRFEAQKPYLQLARCMMMGKNPSGEGRLISIKLNQFYP